MAGEFSKKAAAMPVAEAECPLCRLTGAELFLSIETRDYWRCGNCASRFLDPRQHPSRNTEYAHYLLHENHVDDPGYRRFLSKLAVSLLARLPAASEGLDYGCGPGPALAAMLGEAGHKMALYDPFFYPDPGPLELRYDFVTCTETAEHFHRPAEEFERLMTLIRPGGWLAIMTCFQTDDAEFRDWHYRRDPTHVVFYREETFRYLATERGWRCEIPVKDVVLMQNPGDRE
ncbi:MAG: class I SAM-dependent methyltransferase [Sneathiella sp.]